MRTLAPCPDEETWLAFLSREHAAPRELDAHLASCKECRALIGLLADEDLGGSTSAEHLMSAPRVARERDVDLRLGALVASKWRIEELIGSGGMGHVYRARHLNGHEVAIKFLHAALATRADVVRRFRREGYAANRVAHPAVVKVLDDGDDDGPFLVMELLEGRSCRRAMQQSGTFAPDAALRIVDSAGRALAEAHRAGVVHRDIKPDNIFLTSSDDVRLLDFGLASMRTLTESDSLTVDGVTMGTLGYMAPEQARGDNAQVDARSDVWSMAATCVSLMTGSSIHGGRTSAEQLAFAVTKHAPPVRSLQLGLSRSVEAVLDRALAFDPASRYPDAGAFVEDLTRARTERPHPRSRFRALALGAVVATGLAVAIAPSLAHRPPPRALGGAPGAASIASVAAAASFLATSAAYPLAPITSTPPPPIVVASAKPSAVPMERPSIRPIRPRPAPSASVIATSPPSPVLAPGPSRDPLTPRF